MKLFIQVCLIFIVGFNCNEHSPNKKIGINNHTVNSNIHGDFHYFFTYQISKKSLFVVDQDTLNIYFFPGRLKTYFDKNFVEAEVFNPSYRSDTLIKKKSSFNFSLTEKLQYAKINIDEKKILDSLKLKINYKKIQNYKGTYFFLLKDDRLNNTYESIYVYDKKNNVLKKIQWYSAIHQEEILDFYVYDYKNDGYIDLFVITKDALHDDLLYLTALTSSPYCGEKKEFKTPILENKVQEKLDTNKHSFSDEKQYVL